MVPSRLEVEALAAHAGELKRGAERARRASRRERHQRVGARGPASEGVTIRWARAADAPMLRRLAALDEAPGPAGAVLLAEIEGVAVAALSAEGDDSVADPFVPTESLVRLLALRARQLREAGSRSGHRFVRLRVALR
jgi:hypothetical protein